ncbi:unnamed protein product [Symbiodinium necroappetens]|uniref:Uncharacterized protein n=1 Tax=Symbiodinium necroappetens TaxID=1628268 RepID=A0A813AU35_9DINO|nr:unnamed protein product [Symbiodinium necroappetens]
MRVMMLADKYQVPLLNNICRDKAKDHIRILDACLTFKVAHRLQIAEFRGIAPAQILAFPETALQSHEMLEPQLMLEVLSSPFLCSSATRMWPLLHPWASATGVDLEAFMRRLKEHVQSTDAELRNGLPAKGEYSNNVLQRLWHRYEALRNSEGAGPFLGYWVNLQPSSPSLFQEYQTDIDMLNKLASNRKGLRLKAGQALTWMLPHAAVHVVGLELHNDWGARFQISCSCDGLQWHVLLGSDPEERFQNESLEEDYVLCYSPSPARYFKLDIMDGGFAGLVRIGGILLSS